VTIVIKNKTKREGEHTVSLDTWIVFSPSRPLPKTLSQFFMGKIVFALEQSLSSKIDWGQIRYFTFKLYCKFISLFSE
jgi:hypothetical protein